MFDLKPKEKKRAVWMITMKCNMRCPYCTSLQYKDELLDYPLIEGKKWLKAWNRIKGSMDMDITGGDPLIHPDLIEIINGLDADKTVQITSNLKADVTQFVQEVSPEKCTSITASLHPSDRMNVEYFMGKVLLLKKRDFHVKVNYVAFPEQMWMIPNFRSIFQGLKVPFHVDPYSPGPEYPYRFNESEKSLLASGHHGEDRDDYFNEKPYRYLCDAGMNYFVVYPDGSVSTCTTRRFDKKFQLGSIFDDSFHLLDKPVSCSTTSCPACDVDHTVRVEMTKEHAKPRQTHGENLQLNDREIKKGKRVLSSYPVFHEIETTRKCNMKPPCIMCHTQQITEPAESLLQKNGNLEKIKQWLPYAQDVSLSGLGEPLTDPRIFDLMDCIDTKKTKVVFLTNGLLLNERNAVKLVEHGIEEITISMDAATPRMYDMIRHQSLDRVKENISRLTRIKKERNLSKPSVRLGMVLMKMNIGEVVKFVEMAHEIGAEKVWFKRLADLTDYQAEYKGFYFNYRQQMVEDLGEIHDVLIEKAMIRAKELNVELGYIYEKSVPRHERESLAPPSKPSDEGILCKNPWKRIFVLYNGDVYFCCWLAGPEYRLGNLNEQTLDEIWNGEMAQRIREEMLKSPLPAICQHCETYKSRKERLLSTSAAISE